MRILTFHDLFLVHLHEIYNAEKQLVAALPNIINGVANSDLKEFFSRHFLETESQINRLDQVYFILDLMPQNCPSLPISQYLNDIEEFILSNKPSQLTDTAIMIAVQKIEHYEIALYEALRTFTKHFDFQDITELFTQSLVEEEYGARALVQMFEGGYFYSDICREMQLIKTF